MASVLKNEELESFRESLQGLRSRLRGDLDQMTDEALRRDQPESSGNLSNVPLHMADVGHRELRPGVHPRPDRERAGDPGTGQRGPGSDRRGNVRPLRGMRRADRQAAAPGHPLHAALHPMCTEAGESRMSRREGRGSEPVAPVLVDRAGRGRLRPGDQGDRLRPDRPAARSRRSRSSPTSWSCTPATTPGPSGASGANLPAQQPDLRRPLGRRRAGHLLLAVRPGGRRRAAC